MKQHASYGIRQPGLGGQLVSIANKVLDELHGNVTDVRYAWVISDISRGQAERLEIGGPSYLDVAKPGSE